MTPDRIALVVVGNVFASGGVETSTQRIARALTAIGPFAVDVLVLQPRRGHTPEHDFYERTPTTVLEKVRYFELPCLSTSANPHECAFTAHLGLIALLRRERYRLVHGLYASVAGFHTVYAAAECGIPSVVSLRGNDIHADVFHSGRFGHLQWALEHADRVTAVSSEALRRAHLLTYCGSRGRVILNSIDPASYRAGRERLGPEFGSGPVIGSLAKFRGKKAAGILLAAFGLLHKDIPNARLALVGEIVSESKPEIREMIASMGLSGQVRLTGRIPRRDALRHIRGMDLFVHPALHDGCPNAVLEAMAAGTPIVATAVGAISEMITDGREGRLVPAGSPAALREGMLETLEKPDAGAAYADRAQEAVRTRFSTEREAREFMAVYESCLSIPAIPDSRRVP